MLVLKKGSIQKMYDKLIESYTIIFIINPKIITILIDQTIKNKFS